MGRKTWESLPGNNRPLDRRHNIIVSRTMRTSDEYTVCNSIYDALQFSEKYKFDEAWVIGGTQVYDAVLRSVKVDEVHITNIYNDIECDTFFPDISNDYRRREASPWMNDNDLRYRFLCIFNVFEKILFLFWYLLFTHFNTILYISIDLI